MLCDLNEDLLRQIYDLFSRTANEADIVFPATPWGEKIGTVANSERCISLQKNFFANTW